MRLSRRPQQTTGPRFGGLGQPAIVALVAIVLLASIAIIFVSQAIVEQEAFNLASVPDINALKTQTEIAKLVAEIRQIRSDTSGSLFWLKMMALFVTVGGAVSGYLVGQSRATRARIEFEDRKNVDTAYQAIVQELSDKSSLLRAAAAVKMGTILKSFPYEWNVSQVRQDQLVRLTKEVLAAALAIEKDPKVLKMLTIAFVLHHPWEHDPTNTELERYGDARGLDLSAAKAADAYWARVDFSGADFYSADLSDASLRQAILRSVQFRSTNLRRAVLVDANCEGANFKLADLREADLSKATLFKASFEGAKVYGAKLGGARLAENPDALVDVSPNGDGSKLIGVREWLSQQTSIAA